MQAEVSKFHPMHIPSIQCRVELMDNIEGQAKHRESLGRTMSDEGKLTSGLKEGRTNGHTGNRLKLKLVDIYSFILL